MGRKTSSVKTKIYTFGALRPKQYKLFDDQLWLAHRYYNDLVAAARNSKQSYISARLAASPKLQDIELKIKRVDRIIERLFNRSKKANQKARTKIKNPIISSKIKRMKGYKKELFTLSKHERKIANAAMKGWVDPFPSNQISLRTKYVDEGLFWGTYLLIEAAIKAARQSKKDLKFKKFTGEGRVGVQIQDVGGEFLSTSDVFSSKNKYLQIEPLKVELDSRRNKRAAKTVARLRVGSFNKKGEEVKKGGRVPKWVEIPFKLHRRLPDGIIKTAWVKVSKTGTDKKYELQLSIESEEFSKKSFVRNGAVAFDLGWRKLNDGFRVCSIVDGNGLREEIILPLEIINKLQYADNLRSISDKHFNNAIDILDQAVLSETLPDWVVEDAKYRKQWKSHDKLAKLVYSLSKEFFGESYKKVWAEWKNERNGKDLFCEYEIIKEFANRFDVNPFALYLEFWRKKNRHLYQIESNIKRKTLLRRREFYRTKARNLLSSYSTLIVEDFDLRKIAEKPGFDDSSADGVRKYRFAVAPSEFRNTVCELFSKENIVKVDSKNSSRQCSICGQLNDVKDKVVYKCASCGFEEDRDFNGAVNIYNRGCEKLGGVKNARSSRKTVSG